MKKVTFIMVLSLAATTAWAATPDNLRIVNCDDKVASMKRGICENHLDADDFRALAPGVSWYYNWHYETKDTPPSDAQMEFLPMAWGDSQESLEGLDHYLSSADKKPRVVLCINEPNLRGQSFINPEKTAAFYKKVKDIADKYQLPAVGPNMSLGSPTGDSITAMDPIENKQETYTFMGPFLKAFYFYLGNDVKPPGLGLHTYGNLGEMKWAVETMHKDFNCPVWVTEYADWHASDDNDEREYMIQATDFLERTPYVAGYAWFKERVGENKKISILDKEPGTLTPLGEIYVNMPPHETDIYYRIPGKLSAGRYLAMDQGDILANSHNDILVTSSAPGATFDYNVQVDQAGTYKLSLKCMGSGKIEALENDKVIGSVDLNGSDVQVYDLAAPLPAGTQTLRLRFSASGTILSTIQFAKN
jgi:Glycosyl hydrolase catalytic core